MPSDKPAARDSAYFDRWYADMIASPARDAVIAGARGMPDELRDAGALVRPGLADVAEDRSRRD